MTTDLNQIAAAAANDVQDAIDGLNARKREPGANRVAIEAQIEVLEAKQTEISENALQELEEAPETRDAITAINAASAALHAEAVQIATTADALQSAQKLVGQATDLINALAPFIA